jgi:hypothetical protein
MAVEHPLDNPARHNKNGLIGIDRCDQRITPVVFLPTGEQRVSVDVL